MGGRFEALALARRAKAAAFKGMADAPKLAVENLTMAYGEFVVQRDLSFAVERGEVLIIMGPSGCGKSTLLKHLIGLREPRAGDVRYDGESFTQAQPSRRRQMQQQFGVLYQQGALWSSMTLAENVALPLQQYTRLSPAEIASVVTFKLALVGLAGFDEYYPSEISGGMRKRAGLARAMALDPDILFFDEPSAGLDPITSRRLDDTILEIRESLGTTVVVVTHELPSIFAVGDRAIYLSARERTLTATGNPQAMLANPPNEEVLSFLTRNRTEYLERVKHLPAVTPSPPR